MLINSTPYPQFFGSVFSHYNDTNYMGNSGRDPKFAKIDKKLLELAEKGCGVIGIVADVSGSGDTAMLEEAQELVKMTGVTYPNLIPWDGFYTKLPAAAVPTTYFVDSRGRVLGDPVVGAREGREYKQLLLELLQTVEK